MGEINKREKIYKILFIMIAIVFFATFVISINMRKQMTVSIETKMGSRMISLYSSLENKNLEKYEIILEYMKREIGSMNRRKAESDEYRKWIDFMYSEYNNEKLFEDIEVVVIENEKIITKNGVSQYVFKNDDWYKNAMEIKENVYYTDVFSQNGKTTPSIAMVCLDKSSGNGTMLIFDNISYVAADKQNEMLEGSLYALCDRNEEIIYMTSNDLQQAYIDQFQNNIIKLGKQLDAVQNKGIQMDNQKWQNEEYLIYKTHLKNGWSSVLIVPAESLIKSVKGIWFMYYGLIGFWLLFVVLLFFKMNKNQKLDFVKSIIEAISGVYIEIQCVDLKTRKVLNYKDKKFQETRAEDAIDHTIYDYIAAEDSMKMQEFLNYDTLDERIGNQREISCEYRLSNWGYCRSSIVPIKRDGTGKIQQVLHTIAHIDEQKIIELKMEQKYKDELKNMALHDPLTGVFNRNGLAEIGKNILKKETLVAMLLVDVDYFKNINDIYGHEAGDKALVRVAEILKTKFRSDDVIARLGGDEFMVLLLNCKVENAELIYQKIKEINQELKNPEDNFPKISLSVGAAFSKIGETEGLFNRADEALYKTKRDGRSGCTIYEKMEE